MQQATIPAPRPITRPLWLLAGLLSLSCAGSPHSQAAPAAATDHPSRPLLAAPAYPLVGLVQADPTLRDKEITAAFDPASIAELRHYQFIYRTDNDLLKAVRKAVRKAELDLRVLVYIGSNYTSGRRELAAIESPANRKAVAMIDVATLAEPIDSATQTEVALRYSGEPPIHASTTRRSELTDPKRFDFWIRIDDELMRVLSVDSAARRLSVERGLDSSPVPHPAGAPVLAPCYRGNRREGDNLQKRRTDGYPNARVERGSPFRLSYALDAGAAETRELMARRVGGIMRRGNDGVWIDNFKPVGNWMCDALGARAGHPWNHAADRRYTDAELTDALLELLGDLRQRARRDLERPIYLAANGIAGIYDQPAARRLCRSERDPRGLDVFAFEDSFVKPYPIDPKRGQIEFRANPRKRYLGRVTALQDAARRGLPAVAMTTAAGALGAFFTPELPNYEALERFGWCSFLLTVSAERTTIFGRPVVFLARGGELATPPLGPHYFLDLGDPLEDRSLADYSVAEDCYAREFENALVLVNAGTRPRRIQVPESLRRALGMEELTIDAADGRILMKRRG